MTPAPRSIDSRIRDVVQDHGRLSVDLMELSENADLYDAGMTDSCVPTAKLAQMVLSVAPEGGEPTIVARRLRQPYGIAFPARSSMPLVTVVGQDDLEPHPPPDALVRATPGSDFGFPTCNWATGSSCARFTRPLTLLAPHTTPTGIAVIAPPRTSGRTGHGRSSGCPSAAGSRSRSSLAFPRRRGRGTSGKALRRHAVRHDLPDRSASVASPGRAVSFDDRCRRATAPR